MRPLLTLLALLGALGVTPARAQAALEGGEPGLPQTEASRAETHTQPDTPSSDVGFSDTPLGIAVVAGSGASIGATLYATGAGLGLSTLFDENAPESAFFAVVIAAPLLPAAGALLATLLVRPPQQALRVGAAAVAGGAVGLVLGGVLFFLVGPLLANPGALFIATLFGAPLVASVVGAAAGAPFLAPLPDE